MYYQLVLILSFLISSPAPKLEVLNMDQLQHRIVKENNDTLYVVNFWATWCKPCVNEMPFFINVSKKFANQKMKLVLVSLDFLKERQRVENFITEKSIINEVILLNSGNPNNWINQVDSTWGGAIPATVFYKQGKKIYFREGEFTQAELDSIIQTKIK